MHGDVSIPKIDENTNVNTNIYLLRGMARVDINASVITENIIKLEVVSIHETSNSGRWVSDHRINKNGNPTTSVVTSPTLPNPNTTFTATPSGTVVVDMNKIENQLYVYENTPNSPPESRIVLAEKYNSNTVTAYYSIDITASDNSIMDILRNHHYTIKITGVTGSGYENIIDVANGESIDITANIIEWDFD